MERNFLMSSNKGLGSLVGLFLLRVTGQKKSFSCHFYNICRFLCLLSYAILSGSLLADLWFNHPWCHLGSTNYSAGFALEDPLEDFASKMAPNLLQFRSCQFGYLVFGAF